MAQLAGSVAEHSAYHHGEVIIILSFISHFIITCSKVLWLLLSTWLKTLLEATISISFSPLDSLVLDYMVAKMLLVQGLYII